MSVPDYLYDSLIEYCLVLQEELNKLGNVDEIKSSKKYNKAYFKFFDATNRWLKEKVKKLEKKEKKKNV